MREFFVLTFFISLSPNAVYVVTMTENGLPLSMQMVLSDPSSGKEVIVIQIPPRFGSRYAQAAMPIVDVGDGHVCTIMPDLWSGMTFVILMFNFYYDFMCSFFCADWDRSYLLNFDFNNVQNMSMTPITNLINPTSGNVPIVSVHRVFVFFLF